MERVCAHICFSTDMALPRTGQGNVSELWRLVAMAPADELRSVVEGTVAQPFLEEGNVQMFGSMTKTEPSPARSASTARCAQMVVLPLPLFWELIMLVCMLTCFGV